MLSTPTSTPDGSSVLIESRLLEVPIRCGKTGMGEAEGNPAQRCDECARCPGKPQVRATAQAMEIRSAPKCSNSGQGVAGANAFWREAARLSFKSLHPWDELRLDQVFV
jgi:hypothetical protein